MNRHLKTHTRENPTREEIEEIKVCEVEDKFIVEKELKEEIFTVEKEETEDGLVKEGNDNFDKIEEIELEPVDEELMKTEKDDEY